MDKADIALHHACAKLWADSQVVEASLHDAVRRLMHAMRGPVQNVETWPMDAAMLADWESRVRARYADLNTMANEASTMFDRIKAGGE